MTPEKLKLLAEALGYERCRLTGINQGSVRCGGQAYNNTKFNPESNPAQREEVLLWLLGKGWMVHKSFEFEDSIEYLFNPPVTWSNEKWIPILHKDYTTALMMAAEKEIEGK